MYFQEFLSEPKLFADGASRFDIGQGSAGTCWFLSTVANMAQNQKMVNQVEISILFYFFKVNATCFFIFFKKWKNRWKGGGCLSKINLQGRKKWLQ